MNKQLRTILQYLFTSPGRGVTHMYIALDELMHVAPCKCIAGPVLGGTGIHLNLVKLMHVNISVSHIQYEVALF